jgi:hypothetical protein
VRVESVRVESVPGAVVCRLYPECLAIRPMAPGVTSQPPVCLLAWDETGDHEQGALEFTPTRLLLQANNDISWTLSV